MKTSKKAPESHGATKQEISHDGFISFIFIKIQNRNVDVVEKRAGRVAKIPTRPHHDDGGREPESKASKS